MAIATLIAGFLLGWLWGHCRVTYQIGKRACYLEALRNHHEADGHDEPYPECPTCIEGSR